MSTLTGGSVKKTVALKPDLVVGFSDLQADLARKLFAASLPVLVLNERSVPAVRAGRIDELPAEILR